MRTLNFPAVGKIEFPANCAAEQALSSRWPPLREQEGERYSEKNLKI